jgi:phosphate transport system permease protein
VNTFAPELPAKSRSKPKDSIRSWPLADRIAYGLCWGAGIALCLIAGWIVLYMAIKGISYLKPSLLVQSPVGSPNQSGSGGFLDPIEGTFLVTAIGIAVAAPLGVAVAVWLSEFARPAGLARAVESGVETIAGTPSVVLAIFGLLVFSKSFLAFLSQTSAGGAVFGRSFLTAGLIMSLLAIPLIVGATREALAQVPAHVREASYALGKTKATTIRRVLLPSVRPSIASGITLGMGRIIGDTAIIVILLGASLRLEGAGGAPVLSILRGTGSTLTSYVKENSPAGEGNAPQKAYAAAFVLLVIVIALNALVVRLSGGQDHAGAGR